jgi:hypothetical protein
MALSELTEIEVRSTPDLPVEVPIRREARQDTVRIIEYAPFPRSDSLRRPRTGFTRDLSESGMCVGVDESESVGSLLRVCLRGVDGNPERTAINRVVWCSAERDGRFWIGLELMGEAAPRPV